MAILCGYSQCYVNVTFVTSFAISGMKLGEHRALSWDHVLLVIWLYMAI